jgi:hypothetical protein
MSEQSETESWVDIPAYIEEPFDVYLNGIQQEAGIDYLIVDGSLVFPRELIPHVKMTPLQWFLVGVGIGNYRKHDTVDIAYQRDGRRLVATGLPAHQRDSLEPS